MKNYYTAYAKQVDGTTYYFVKWYVILTEIANVSPILKGYGMHTDFNRACSIAAIHDHKIKEQLLQEVNANAQQAKVIELNNDAVVRAKVR